MKQRTRKSDTERRNYTLQTGGGPPPQDNNDPIEEQVRAILPTIDFEIKNNFDSIALFEAAKNVDETATSSITTHKEPGAYSFHSLTILDDHDYKRVTVEKGNESIKKDTGEFKKRKRGRFNKENRKKYTHIDEEAALRKIKLEESMEQQRELHNVKMEAAKEEKRYWQIRADCLLKEGNNLKNVQLN
ncbi:unnamed protein product [Psylliodes chrysocephalus]|uniref:Uncharacterized protein n=1 Tax=Psylliodes chrysocephalus TaxID=3402493 RepID=A0A9P0CUN8_9CUCU|nr:unnamed protein product [Psylliodes chrysocephala]